jgi:hypothetical protein
MSWAAHNPEKYEEIMRNGIRHWLWQFLPDKCQANEAFQSDLDYMLSEMASDFKTGGHEVFELLAKFANEDICDAESNYWSSFGP